MKTLINNFKRATIEMLLLSLLEKEDMYGYQIVQTLKKKSDGRISVLEGSMYPILYRLSESGDIVCEEIKVGVRLTRIYYHMTDSGKVRLEELKKTFHEYIDVVNGILEEQAAK